MQNIILRDLLKILIDKTQTLKSYMVDRHKMKKVLFLLQRKKK